MKRVKAYLGKLKGNAAVCIAAHPFWAIPYMFYTYYISLYLQERGISDVQLGTLMVAGTVSATFFSFLAAPVVDRLGRRNATSLFDFLSSALPPLLYFFTRDFGMALIAMVLFNANRLMSVGYYLVMIEDSEDDGKIVAMNMFNIITVVAGLLLPVAGLYVEKQGLVKGEETFLLASFFVITVMIIVRHLLLKETKVGETVRAKVKAEPAGIGTTIRQLWTPYRDALRFLAKNPVARAFALANVFFCVYMNLGTNYSLYFVPYFSDRMGMNTMQSSVLGSVYYGGMLAAMVLINPSFSRKNLTKGILLSCAVTLAGFALMITVPSGVYVLAIGATLVLALGYGMLKSAIEGALAVYSESEYRSGIYSAANLLSSGLGVIVTAICSVMYSKDARWLYILNGIMVLCVLITILHVSRTQDLSKTRQEADDN
ncbi:MAG: MFS transporter [Lachnospiraceae bacterium]|nr:MFS transporter [Lachnospiraceae bacterium]